MNLLVIAQNIPTPETNAGDYRIFQILKILSKKYKVFFLPATKKLYKTKYFLKLKFLGIKILELKNIYDIEKLIKKNRIRLILFEFFTSAKKFSYIFENKIRPKIVIDSHCIKYLQLRRAKRIGLMKGVKDIKEEEMEVYEKADLVIAINDYEKKILERHISTPISVIPTCVSVKKKINPREKRKDILFVGYMRNIENEDAVFYFVEKIFPIIRKKIKGIKFYIVGANPTDKVKKLSTKDIIVTGYVRDLMSFYEKSVVSVVPLRTGAGDKLKILESLSCGTPVVSSSVGVKGMKFKNKRDILVSDDHRDFAENIIELYQNENLWNKFSKNGYDVVKKLYNIDVMEKLVLNCIKL